MIMTMPPAMLTYWRPKIGLLHLDGLEEPVGGAEEESKLGQARRREPRS